MHCALSITQFPGSAQLTHAPCMATLISSIIFCHHSVSELLIVQIAFRPVPGPERGSSKRGSKEKKPCACDYFLPSLFRSASQDPDVLLVPHRFVFHMEREVIINMKHVSESGPHKPVVQPMVAPVITTNSFTEISDPIPSVATVRPSLIDTCRPSGLSFCQPSQPSFGLGFPQPSSSQHGFGLGFSQPGGSLDSSSMQIGLGMMPQ